MNGRRNRTVRARRIGTPTHTKETHAVERVRRSLDEQEDSATTSSRIGDASSLRFEKEKRISDQGDHVVLVGFGGCWIGPENFLVDVESAGLTWSRFFVVV